MEKYICITLCLLLAVVVIYKIVEKRNWKTIWIKTATKVIDNTQTEFYQTYGFHEYDTMSDQEQRECIVQIKQHVKTGHLKIVYDGDYRDKTIVDEAESVFNDYNRKHSLAR